MKDLDSVSKSIQFNENTVSQGDDLLDASIKKYPGTASRLSWNASIVNSPLFESSVVKIQLETQEMLSREDRKILSDLESSDVSSCDSDYPRFLFSECALKCQKGASVGTAG